MKILILSTQDLGSGASLAAYRLNCGLRNLGEDSRMLVQEKRSIDPFVIQAYKTRVQQGIAHSKLTLDAAPFKLYSNRQKAPLSLNFVPDRLVSKIKQLNPDIINLHWINAGYISIGTISMLRRPIVWTLHDMWPFTGCCHYDDNCNRYETFCGSCPQLGSNQPWDLSRWLWKLKRTAWRELDFTIVAPSSWLAKRAKMSSIFKDFRVETIPNSLDIRQYRPINRKTARELLNLPQDRYLLLFGALKATSDKRKGFHLLQSALRTLIMSGFQDKLDLVILGSFQPNSLPDLEFKTHYMGLLNDNISLSLVYSAADVFILPSVQENLPNAVMEALSCGIPCIAFHIGGVPDMIEHQRNGYLAQPFKVEDLARGILWILENYERRQELSFYARKKVEQQFSQEIQANRYTSLFSELLDEN